VVGEARSEWLEAPQVLAASLVPPLLPAEEARQLVAALERELLTPGGLRDASESSRVCTHWMGSFLSAWVRAHGRSPDAQQRARGWADRFRRAIEEFATGEVPEGFELAEGANGAIELRTSGSPLSVLASAEMARFWVEELDHEPRA
jgi:glycogen debranching enzyme